jgi:hypothetical protein
VTQASNPEARELLQAMDRLSDSLAKLGRREEGKTPSAPPKRKTRIIRDDEGRAWELHPTKGWRKKRRFAK